MTYRIRCEGLCGEGRGAFSPIRDYKLITKLYKDFYKEQPIKVKYFSYKCPKCGHELMTEVQAADLMGDIESLKEIVDDQCQ